MTPPSAEPAPWAAPASGADRALSGRTALVTGASRGIGLAVARALAWAGADVALLSRSADALALHAEAIAGAYDVRAVAVPADLAQRAALEDAAARAVAALGGAPDVLVNNAGRFDLAPVAQASVESVFAALDANLAAPFVLVRAMLPAMLQRARGHVVSVGSIADRHAFPENGAYAASKFGLRGFHEVLRAELRGTGVRASLVSPGPVDTPLWDPIDPDGTPGFTPRASMLSADAVARAILFAVTAPAELNVDELRISRA